ncbi:Late embryogenesis abundant protein 47 [Hirschfeldia incana]|nr:Late embryogenesis abundant protein 47 [Hirschfeldia incana]
MSVEQLEKPITNDVKQEAENIPATENREKGVVADASGGQAEGDANEKNVVASSPASEGIITIGEALEAAVLTAGNKPVEWSDAAAIQAAEVRATGRTNIMPGGVAACAQSAATLNARANSEDDKTTLAVVLTGARSKLPSDKPATRKDAEGVTGADMRNDPHLTTYPTGVAASVAAAARINQAK